MREGGVRVWEILKGGPHIKMIEKRWLIGVEEWDSNRGESRCIIGPAGLQLPVKTNGAPLNIKRPTKQMPDGRVIKKQFIGFMGRES